MKIKNQIKERIDTLKSLLEGMECNCRRCIERKIELKTLKWVLEK